MSDEQPPQDQTPVPEQPEPTPDPNAAERDAKIRDMAFDRAHRARDYAWRPHVFEGMFSHLPIAEGELSPLQISATALRSIPGLAQMFAKEVPDNYVSVDLNEEGFSTAVVACPCGNTHAVEIGTIVVADCGRSFYWFGQAVHVAKLDSEPEAESQD